MLLHNSRDYIKIILLHPLNTSQSHDSVSWSIKETLQLEYSAQSKLERFYAKMRIVVFLLSLLSTAVTGDPAKPCDSSQCKLPNCRCAGEDIPGNLTPTQTPQIVVITFDDSVRDLDYTTYYSQLLAGRKNPNGCNIGWTFFVTHYYTDYALVEELYSQGHEIADHSVTHRTPETWWTNATEAQLAEEIVDQQDMFANWANIPKEKVIGYRAPYLATSENEIKALYSNNFTWECSMPTSTYYWPFTLDYKSPLCNLPATCPTDAYPGLWIIPNIVYTQSNGVPCNMLDACSSTNTQQEWYDLMMNNFLKHYNGNRAPFGLFAHSALFYRNPTAVPAYKAFLDKLATLKNIYIVTISQLIDWMKQPTPLDQIASFTPWQCTQRPQPRCDHDKGANNCHYPNTPHGDMYLKTCVTTCPPHYPDIGNPSGN